MMPSGQIWTNNFQNAIGRWAGVGPYYAMFPNEFAFDVVSRFTEKGDWILDPFAGRFSSIFAATSQGRNGIGIEINPVGWVYGQAKVAPAAKDDVLDRIEEINSGAHFFGERSRRKLPIFFSHCYAPSVLSFLLAARKRLDWKNNPIDTTAMALILVVLHAKIGTGLSNQMRQSKAMAPDYSVRWWKERKMKPPEIDPVSFLEKKIEWRYAKGIPQDTGSGVALLGDSTLKLPELANQIEHGLHPKFKLVLTSPPYYNITHYHYDQWLRHWMLGGPDTPSKREEKNRGRFSSQIDYEGLLRTVFESITRMVANDATIYVRTDRRQFTLDTTRRVLADSFPLWTMNEVNQPIEGYSQTALFGDFGRKPGEVDIILRR